MLEGRKIKGKRLQDFVQKIKGDQKMRERNMTLEELMKDEREEVRKKECIDSIRSFLEEKEIKLDEKMWKVLEEINDLEILRSIQKKAVFCQSKEALFMFVNEKNMDGTRLEDREVDFQNA